MALEEELSTLTDHLDQLVTEMGGERPSDIYSFGERLQIAIQEGFDGVQETLSEIEGAAITQNQTENFGEEQISDIFPAEMEINSLVAEEMMAENQPAGEEMLRGQEAVQATRRSIEGGEEVPGVSQALQDFGEIQNAMSALIEETDVGKEELEVFVTTFENFYGKVSNIKEKLNQDQIEVNEAESQIQDIAEQISGKFESITDEDFEEFDEAVQNLITISEKFFENVQSAAEVSQQTPGQEFTGEQISQVGGAIGQIGDAQFLQALRDTTDQIGSVLTGGQVDSVVPSAQELQQANGLFEAISSKVKQIASSISATQVAIATLLAPLAMAADLLEDAFGAAREFREETGVGAERMRELRTLTAQVSTELAGFGLDPGATTDIALSLQQRFGTIATATDMAGENLRTLVEQSGALSGRLGTSASESAKFLGTFVELENLIGGSAQSAAATAVNLAEANDVAPQAVMQDITENSEKLAMFSGNTTESLAKAAVEAQRLGTSLGSVAQFQEQALTGITDQVQRLQEAQMLTGQQFNTTALIQASYEGTGEALDEITSQLEGIDFENLDFFQRRSLEQAFPGFSIEELQRLSEGQETLEEVTTTVGRAQEIGAGELSFAQAIQADNVDEVERLRRQFNQLYFVLAEELFPVLSDITDAVLPGLTALLKAAGPVVSGFASIVRGLSSIFQVLIGDFEGAKESLYALIEPFEDIYIYLTRTKKEAEQASEKIDVLSSSLETVGLVLGGLWAGKKITGLVTSLGSFGNIIGKVGGKLSKWVPSFLKWGTAGEVVEEGAEKMSSGSSSMLASFKKLAGVSAVILSIGGGVMMLAEAAKMFAEVDTQALVATGGALAGLVGGVIGVLTAISATGVGALAMGAAAGVLAAFAGSVWVLAEAAQGFAEAAQMMIPVWNEIVDGVMKLAEIPTGALFGVAGGIGAIGAALAGLGALSLPALVGAGTAGLITYLFGDSITGQLETISGMASEIAIVASSVETLATSLQTLQGVDISGVVNQLDSLGGIQTQAAITAAAAATEGGPEVQGQQDGGQTKVTSTEVNQQQGPQLDVQPAQQNVATIDQQAAQPAQTGGTQEEIRLDSDTDDVEGLLQEILVTQKKFLQDLREGKIAIYLDGRKVNKELVRGLEVT